MVGPIREKLRRRKDAATLIEVAGGLDAMNSETLYLSKEMSLSNVASEMWEEFQQSLPQQAHAARMKSTLEECNAGFAALGRAAQASLKAEDKLKVDVELAFAGRRAKRAIEEMEKLAGSYSEVADDVKAAGARQFNEAWRRDALRAVLALERAPETLQTEIRRQRLRGLRKELKVLRLDKHKLETITAADVRTARATRAKALHPDIRNGQAATEQGEAPRGIFGLVRNLFGGPREQERPADDEKAWAELNAAYDAVHKAVSAPVYALDTNEKRIIES